MELFAESDGGLEHSLFRHPGVKIQLISLRSACEAFVDMKIQVRGEATAEWIGGNVDRARSAELVAGSFAGHEADQVQNLGQGDPDPNFGERDARHGESWDDVGGVCQARSHWVRHPREQRRGTRNMLI